MRFVRLMLLGGALFVSVPSAGAPQNTDATSVSESRSALLSGVLEWYVPTMGYAYAGDWSGGLLPNAVRLGGVVAIWVGVGTDSESVLYTGVVAFTAGTVWAVAGAAHAARRRSGGRPPEVRQAPSLERLAPPSAPWLDAPRRAAGGPKGSGRH